MSVLEFGLCTATRPCTLRFDLHIDVLRIPPALKGRQGRIIGVSRDLRLQQCNYKAMQGRSIVSYSLRSYR